VWRSWHALRSVPRLREILMVVARHGFGHALNSLHLPFGTRILHFFRKRTGGELTQPQRFRRMLEDLGPTFVKFGQLLGTRPDLLPQEYIDELERLHDHVDPLPFEALAPILREELGRDPAELFASIEHAPLGSASIAQVHRARTRAGEEVVVKIQRPGIERTIERDLKVIFLVAQIIREIEDLSHFDPLGTARVFEHAIRRELDFRHELHNIARIARHAEEPRVRIPKIHRELSSRRVLTLEFLPGATLKEAEATPELRHELAQGLTSAMFRQIFVDGVFHADPHPGNLLVMPEGALGMIDFGSAGRLPPSSIGELVGFLTSLVQRDYQLLARQIMKSGSVAHNVDQKELAAELMECLDPYYDLPLAEVDLAPIIRAVFGILMRHRIRIPTQYVLLGRALVILEGTVRKLDPTFALIEELKPHAKRIFTERWKPASILREARLDIYDAVTTLRELPGVVGGILHRLNEGNLKTRIAIEDIRNIESRLDRLNSQLPLGLLASSVLLSGTLFIVLAKPADNLPTVALGAYVIAGVLGLWFLWPRRK
jgi:ubiquinone biosynthesis protein